MSSDLGFSHFLAQSDGVARFILAAMLLMSVVTWFLIVYKTTLAVRMRTRGRRFLDAFWQAPTLEAVAGRLRDAGSADPFSNLVHHGLTAVEQHRVRDTARRLLDVGTSDEFVTRALKRAIAEGAARLEFGQVVLATVASTAPFIGLLGTVWGIYHALLAIGAAGDAGLDKVAGPVGEALIMTGLGLAVAIPAAVAYNFFARGTRRLRGELESFAYDVFVFLGTGAKSGPGNAGEGAGTGMAEGGGRALRPVRSGAVASRGA